MFRYPGMLTTEFLEGKRRKYTSPLRLYIVVSVAFFLWAAWIASRGLLLDSGQTMDADAGGQAQFLSEGLPRLMFVFLPLFATLLKIAFHRRLYFDHIIHSLHMHTVAYIVLAVMLPLEEVGHWFLIALQTLVFAYFPYYVVVSTRRVYDTGWLEAALKVFAVLFAYMVVVALVIEGASNFKILSD